MCFATLLLQLLDLYVFDFLRYKKEDHYMDAVAKVADFVGCRQENLLLVENSTSGLDGHLYKQRQQTSRGT